MSYPVCLFPGEVQVQGPGGRFWRARQWLPGDPMPFASCRALGLDTETEPLEKGVPIRPVMLQISGDMSDEILFVHWRHFSEALDYIDTNYPSTVWVFFNAPFDCRVLGWPYGPLTKVMAENRLVDMEIRGILHSLQEGTYLGKMNLAELTRRQVGWEMEKDKGLSLSFRQDKQLSMDQVWYGSYDVIATVEDWAKIPEPYPTEDINTCGYFALSDISARGMRVDMDRFKELSEVFVKEQRRLYMLLQVFGIAPGDPNIEGSSSPPGVLLRKQELLHALEEQYDVRLPKTPSKAISTEKKTLDLALIVRGIPVPNWLRISRDYEHARKMRKTYLNPAKVGLDGRVHPRFSPLMKTGRTSCSDPNIQNMPKDGGLRGIYIPEDGYLFLATDFAQLELCALAQSCWSRFGRSKMRELINEGADLHYWFGDILATKVGKYFDPNDKDNEERKAFRQRAKAALFGFPGGLGAATFVAYARNYKVSISIDDAKELKELWTESFPEMKQHLQPRVDEYWTSRNIAMWLSRHKMQDPKVRTLSDLASFLSIEGWEPDDIFKAQSEVSAYECRLVSGRLKRNCTYCAATNMQFQGPSADGAKVGLWEGYVEGWRTVDFIHDEVIQEVPLLWTPVQHTEFAAHVEDVLCTSMRRVLPDVKIKASSALMARWYKEAERLTDDDGCLMVWTPERAKELKERAEAEKAAKAAAAKAA